MEAIKNSITVFLTFFYSFFCVHGIDVSHRQGVIDWRQVTEDQQNIQFAYIKATEGATFKDSMFLTNAKQAHEAGLEVGAYHFFKMTSTPEAQFKNFKKSLDDAKDYLTMIPVLDVETFDNKSSKEVKAAVQKFVDLFVKEYQVYPVIYGPDIAPSRMLPKQVNDSCMFFLGQPAILRPQQEHDIWQYSARGTVKGISKQVDLDMLHSKRALKELLW